MGFKEWILLEFDDSGSDWFYGSFLRPSDAGDWPYAWSAPQDFVFLQSRWDQERDMGRKLHGIDLDKELARDFVTTSSPTMPDGGDGFWKHNNKERPNIKVHHTPTMDLHGVRTKGDVSKKLSISNDLLDKKSELNRIFGDFKPKYPVLSKDFDEPWVHNENMTSSYQVFGPGTWNLTNDKMGIPSRLLGPDETGEREQEKHIKTANFGKKRRWKKVNPYAIMAD
jgi:hypothetical protein